MLFDYYARKKEKLWEEAGIKYTNRHIPILSPVRCYTGYRFSQEKESVEILLESFKYLQKSDNLKLYAYVILENHLHIVAQSDDIAKSMAKFKRHTARQLIKLLEKENVKTILDQLAFY